RLLVAGSDDPGANRDVGLELLRQHADRIDIRLPEIDIAPLNRTHGRAALRHQLADRAAGRAEDRARLDLLENTEARHGTGEDDAAVTALIGIGIGDRG